ncbi:hypothetical protein AB4Z39_31630 [Mycobacterium adipatum]|uniref:hypothetical protein n=1 Tax=Mycobacterium adipatum TaxID=1682113 RepID=UPI0034E0A13D
MGLDVSHDCWSGAYSGFNRWRDELARVAGYEFATVKERPSGAQIFVDWGHVEYDWMFGEWPFIPCRIDGTPDPLLLIVLHADTEGRLKHEHLVPIADRLTELLPLLEGDGGGHVGGYREATQQFINGLRLADMRKEDVVFS